MPEEVQAFTLEGALIPLLIVTLWIIWRVLTTYRSR